MFASSANYNKIKTNLRLVVNRLKLLEKKKTELALKSRKEIADYIQTNKDDRARIRVEHIIREDYTVEAYELIEMYCDLLLARFGLIQTTKEIDPGLEEAISSLLWAAPRIQAEVQEMKIVVDQFRLKYGKEYVDACFTDKLGTVNKKLKQKMGVEAPPKILVERYMMEIAKTYNVNFVPDPAVMVRASDELLMDIGRDPMHPMPQMPPLPPQGPIVDTFQQPPVVYPQPHPMGPYVPPAATGHPPMHPYGMPPSGGGQQFVVPPPSYHEFGNQAGPLPQKQPFDVNLLDLPQVPNNLPSGSGPRNDVNNAGPSAPRDDIDFDDLTRRFEDLKKKK